MVGDETHGPGPDRERLASGVEEPEVCELCGALITDGSQRYGLVPDPSARYSLKPEWNGQRFVVACSVEHMKELYRRGEQAVAEHQRGRE